MSCAVFPGTYTTSFLRFAAFALQFLDGTTWGGIFGLPKQVRKGLAEEKRIMTVDNPVFMY